MSHSATDTATSLAAAAGTILLGGELEVNRLGFGAMRVTGRGVWGEPPDRQAALRVLRRAVELGINFIDTADSYGPGTSERLLAEALYPYPKDMVIATKGGLIRPGPDQWERDARPEHLRAACEGSLSRLRLQRIDVYQLHAPDSKVPFEDSVGELVRLQQEGKIRLIGLSNVSVSELRRAQRLATIVSVQNRYSIGDRTHEELLEHCHREGIPFIPWYPLGAGRHVQGGMTRESDLARIAREHGITLSRAAIAWLLARSPVMLPIPGTSSIAHLEENVAAAAVRLTLS